MRDKDRESVLKQVQAVREGTLAHRHLPWARHAFRIPERDYHALLRMYPNLGHLDPQVKSAAWEAFEKTPFAEAYRIGKIHRGVIRNGLIMSTR